MLVLLVIFMITAPLLTEGVKVELPQADANPLQEDAQRPIVFTVDKSGQYYVTYDDDKSVPLERDELLQKASQAGYAAAFTIDRRHASNREKTMAQPRYMVVSKHDLKAFENMLNGEEMKRSRGGEKKPFSY
jgi:biopolymer transport protein ExbD